ncbi:TonB-dependent receptor [Porphyromonas circumdentaria]|uniref:Outer membrane receptor proteins, mostly Fe transport n=1 Tax=Porphyromonas circumdentaria TaxID=29524 RepID=A0A1T4PNA0_9PORP|nr:TonB-dependent receptor [Porphyromonas circumdentaria]MBB6276489.1 outer membrane receptor protein involved in Fe transport [Porphyromonas circumdentaria]SJZ93075.1 Outer membrane receptor proteins, mostly Fe transport [Porphyromonas circumdentaria]
MRQNRVRFMSLLLLTLISIGWTYAQTLVTGKVLDKELKSPIVGASVSTGQGATLKGTTTDAEGNFKLEVPRNATLTIRSVGYVSYTHKLSATTRTYALGTIYLVEDAVSLGQVEVIASIVPKDRKVPVPVSNISLAQIESKAFNTEFPELLKSTPSVYVTRSGGGFGDSRIMMRGFDTNNLGVLINGVPVNDMENGRVYWSNWAGLNDVSSLVQVQRGLGASRLGISSVGGTINIVTKNVDAKKGGSVYTGIGNDQYVKYGFSISTGLMDNGWAVTASGATSYGDGYVKGTDFRGWSYFLNLSKKINEDHTLSFTAFGAPQWHNQRSARHTQEQYAEHPDKERMNLEYGYLNGGVYSARHNFYHKPQLSLNHLWRIDERSSLSTAVYASIANGGGRRVDGKIEKVGGKTVRYTNWIEAYRGKLDPIAKRTASGLVDWESIFAANAAEGDKGSKVILANSVNNHQWYGILSTYRNRLDEQFTITAGVDGRLYKGDHYKQVYDLLGGVNYQNQLLKNQIDAGKTFLKPGDIFDYHNIGEVVWGGAFAQGEFTSDEFDAFLSGSLTYQGYRYLVPDGYNEANYKKLAADIRDRAASDRVNFMPFSIKAGASYKFLDYNNVFVNAGYFTRAPHFGGTFLNYSAEINKNLTNEKILTAELGYGFTNEYVRVNLNGYYTKWNDRFLRRSSVLDTRQYFNFRGLNAQHMGVELEAEARPVDELRLNAMISWGDWRWGGKTLFDVYDESQTKVGDGEINLKGVHVGNSAQFTAAFGFDWEVFSKLHLRGNVNYFGKNYADFEPTNRLSKKGGEIEVYTGDAWKMPDYTLVDLSVSYNFELYKGMTATIFGGVNNLFNTRYIADATDGVKVDSNNVRTGEDALVWYGFGRTWQMGMRVNF